MKTIDDVIKNDMCSGCGLCVDNAESMIINKEGYSRPVRFINDDISLNCCPGISVAHHNTEKYNLSWGPIVKIQTGFSNNSSIRYAGSSGGVLTALATFLLETKKVDAVIQIGVEESCPIRNITKIVIDPSEIVKNAGSRYSPSSPLNVIRGTLNDSKVYAVIGKPCDISAMRALVSKDDVYKNKFPYLLSFMCAGIPSEKATNNLLSELGVNPKDLISFRYRGEGWPGLTKAVTSSGTEKTMSYNDSWGKILNKYLQVRCKMCADGIGESADIVCADAWFESESGYPLFEEVNGRSLIITRTSVGQELIDTAIQSKSIVTQDYSTDLLENIQPYQSNRKKSFIARKLALNLFGVKVTKFTGYQLWNNFLILHWKLKIKAFLGTVIRKFKGRM